jgi:glycosyltransferase involved in cell wall biosynthesis
MSTLPWITCVCVSRNRPAFLRRAVRYFQWQTYPRKDLVIVREGDEVVSGLTADLTNITVIDLPHGTPLTLGERRNISIQHAKGDYFCQWDDDDWYHSNRLEIQMSDLRASEKPACVLNRLILYDQPGNQAYLSSERFWEGTLLCKTEIVRDRIQYPKVNISEDNSLVVALIKRGWVHSLTAPFLYAYVYHRGNTWDLAHFQQLFHAGYKLDKIARVVIENALCESADYAEASAGVNRLNLEVPKGVV